MSRRIKAREEVPPLQNMWQLMPWVLLVVTISALLTIGLKSFLTAQYERYMAQRRSDEVAVLDTRIVLDSYGATMHGSWFRYRAEALVEFAPDGRNTQRMWVSASDPTGVHRELEVKLAAKPKFCTMRWSPERPESASCFLH